MKTFTPREEIKWLVTTTDDGSDVVITHDFAVRLHEYVEKLCKQNQALKEKEQKYNEK